MDGRRIHNNNVPFSKLSGIVWTGPEHRPLPFGELPLSPTLPPPGTQQLEVPVLLSCEISAHVVAQSNLTFAQTQKFLKISVAIFQFRVTMMSFWSGLFGANKENKATTTAEAIQKLKQTEELLEKKQAFLEKKIENELELAKINASKNKRVALATLKRKKRLEKQLTQLDGTLSTLEFQRDALENASTNTEVVKNMAFAAQALKAVHNKLDVDDVHDIMDDIQEQQQISEEINDALVAMGNNSTDIDEDELNEELDELEREAVSEHLSDVPELVPTSAVLPEVPGDDPAGKNRTETDDELRELETWLS